MSSTFPPSAATDPDLSHHSQVSSIMGICLAFLVFMTFIVAVRLWIRWKLVRGKFGADDWFVLAAWFFAALFDVSSLVETFFGLGQHLYDLPEPSKFSKALKLAYFNEIIYHSCVAVTKISILTLYLRLAAQRSFRRLVWIAIALVTVCWFPFILVAIFQCSPIHEAWDMMINRHCINLNALFFAGAGIDIFQDVLVYVLPMRMLYQLQIPPRQRYAIMSVFAVGAFVVITGMVRLNYITVAVSTRDLSYDDYRVVIWSVIECNVGVICACLPTSKPLLDRLFPHLMGHRGAVSKDISPIDPITPSQIKIPRLSNGQSKLEYESNLKDPTDSPERHITSAGIGDIRSSNIDGTSDPSETKGIHDLGAANWKPKNSD